jgi:type II secretion system protein G
MKTQKQKGFTLIELLVVVAIIGVLATLVLSSLSNARSRSRDARRLADIRTIQTALEVYYVDNGVYPVPPLGYARSYDATWNNLETLLGTTLPVDPVNIRVGNSWNDSLLYFYQSNTSDYVNNLFCNGKAYVLIFALESRNGNGRFTGCNGVNYEVEIQFWVGVDRDNFITPNLSGSLRE